MSEQQKADSSCTATSNAYRVQVRSTNKPLVLADGDAIGSEWQTLPVIRVCPPGTAYCSTEDDLTYSFSYYGAIALAASFLSQHPHRLGLECRLIEYRRVITHEMFKVVERDLISAVDMAFAVAVASRDQK